MWHSFCFLSPLQKEYYANLTSQEYHTAYTRVYIRSHVSLTLTLSLALSLSLSQSHTHTHSLSSFLLPHLPLSCIILTTLPIHSKLFLSTGKPRVNDENCSESVLGVEYSFTERCIVMHPQWAHAHPVECSGWLSVAWLTGVCKVAFWRAQLALQVVLPWREIGAKNV